MSVETILDQIDEEIQKWSAVRALLTGGDGVGIRIVSANGKRVVSASARRKMAAAQKRRWATFHAAKGKTTAKLTLVQPGPKSKRMSPAARKRIAAAQRARWAKLRAANKKTA